MEMQTVNSGHICSLGWEDDTMLVQFSNGSQYAYHGVSYDLFKSILEAPSVGKAVNCCGVRGQVC